MDGVRWKAFLVAVAGLAFLAALPTAEAAAASRTLVAKESGCPAGRTLCFDTDTISVLTPVDLTLTIENPATNQDFHTLCVEVGSGMSCPKGDPFAPGNSGTWTISVQKISQDHLGFWCGRPGHQEAGMEGKIFFDQDKGFLPGMEAVATLLGASAALGLARRSR